MLRRVSYSDDLCRRLISAAHTYALTSRAYLSDVDFTGLLPDSYALTDAQLLPITV